MPYQIVLHDARGNSHGTFGPYRHKKDAQADARALRTRLNPKAKASVVQVRKEAIKVIRATDPDALRPFRYVLVEQLPGGKVERLGGTDTLASVKRGMKNAAAKSSPQGHTWFKTVFVFKRGKSVDDWMEVGFFAPDSTTYRKHKTPKRPNGRYYAHLDKAHMQRLKMAEADGMSRAQVRKWQATVLKEDEPKYIAEFRTGAKTKRAPKYALIGASKKGIQEGYDWSQGGFTDTLANVKQWVKWHHDRMDDVGGSRRTFYVFQKGKNPDDWLEVGFFAPGSRTYQKHKVPKRPNGKVKDLLRSLGRGASKAGKATGRAANPKYRGVRLIVDKESGMTQLTDPISGKRVGFSRPNGGEDAARSFIDRRLGR